MQPAVIQNNLKHNGLSESIERPFQLWLEIHEILISNQKCLRACFVDNTLLEMYAERRLVALENTTLR